MYELSRLSTNKHLRAVGGLLAGLVLGLQVNAQTVAVPDAAFQRFMWTTTGANSQSVTVGTGGVPVVSPTGSGTLAADGTKSLAYSRNASWRNASSNPVSGSLSAKIPINAKTAKLLTAGMKAVPFLGTGVALWEMATELGYNPTKEPDGSLSVSKNDPAVCTVAPCYQYWHDLAAAGVTPRFSSLNQASQAALPMLAAKYGGTWYVVSSNATWVYFSSATYTNWSYGIQKVAVAPSPPTYLPSTIEDLENAIAEKSGWPTNSKIPSAVRDAATATGQTVDVELPKITGPATSPGTTKTTTNPTAGTTTTTATTHNHTYNDNRVTNTITTAVNVTNNTTGTTTTETTTEEPVEEPAECEKNPYSLNCSDLDTPSGEIPKVEKVISYQAEDLGFGGGSCPADVTMTPKGAASPITVINWVDNCQKITTYAKPMILSMALFSALMIVFVGGRPE